MPLGMSVDEAYELGTPAYSESKPERYYCTVCKTETDFVTHTRRQMGECSDWAVCSKCGSVDTCE